MEFLFIGNIISRFEKTLGSVKKKSRVNDLLMRPELKHFGSESTLTPAGALLGSPFEAPIRVTWPYMLGFEPPSPHFSLSDLRNRRLFTFSVFSPVFMTPILGQGPTVHGCLSGTSAEFIVDGDPEHRDEFPTLFPS